MRAIQLHQPGGPELLVLREVPTPVPGPTELLVRTEAIGVNYVDIYQRAGVYATPSPIRLGLEGAGVVESTGAGVAGIQRGDRVGWTGTPGSYATHVVVPAERAIPLPPGIDSRLAAAVLLQGMTAHYLAFSVFPLKPGHAALVHAAAGGVGLLLVQIARRAGARVIGTASTEAKATLARAAGAETVVLYGQQDFEAAARAFTNGRGVDVVYDSVGKTTFHKSLASLAPRGYLALYGQSSGAVAPIDPQVLSPKGLFLTRPSLGTYTATRAELLGRAEDIFSRILRGELDVRIDRTLPLDRAGDAHRALESRATAGKLLLSPA